MIIYFTKGGECQTSVNLSGIVRIVLVRIESTLQLQQRILGIVVFEKLDSFFELGKGVIGRAGGRLRRNTKH